MPTGKFIGFYHKTIKIKLHRLLGPALIDFFHQNQNILLSNNFSTEATYELLYFSKKTNRFEKRMITPVKELRLGSQQLIEAYCFRRKAVRWFEIGRIKRIKLLEIFHPIPKTARHYFQEMVIQCQKQDLAYLKWAFHDVMIAYNQKQIRIKYSEKENVLKELSPLKSVQVLNNHSN